MERRNAGCQIWKFRNYSTPLGIISQSQSLCPFSQSSLKSLQLLAKWWVARSYNTCGQKDKDKVSLLREVKIWGILFHKVCRVWRWTKKMGCSVNFHFYVYLELLQGLSLPFLVLPWCTLTQWPRNMANPSPRWTDNRSAARVRLNSDEPRCALMSVKHHLITGCVFIIIVVVIIIIIIGLHPSLKSETMGSPKRLLLNGSSPASAARARSWSSPAACSVAR